MIKINLTQRIWLAFISLIVLVGLSVIIIFPISIKDTLTEESYWLIEREQERATNGLFDFLNPPQDGSGFFEQSEAGEVFHFVLYDTLGMPPHGDHIPPAEVIREMAIKAFAQESLTGRYELQYGGQTVFYVVKEVILDQKAYHIAYMWDTYRDEMVNKLWERLLYLFLLTSVLSLLPAIWLKHYLRQPLIILGNHLEQIANRDWKEPLKWKGDEDFQRLSDQFEKMRQNLNMYDSAQKTFIQHASHELKTPIMVIKSYAQSVKDGILPKQNLERTMDVIIEESNRMERRVIDMLYYTKLDSYKEDSLNQTEFYFGQLAFKIEERFRMQREDVSIHVLNSDVKIKGDEEQLEVLIENLVENALRYAISGIWINAEKVDKLIRISVENDGETIPEDDIPKLFNPFYKGNNGKFGLGLAIVKRIAELHHGYPEIENTDKGVKMKVYLPAIDDKKSNGTSKNKKKQR
ncbi:sensor histidine kinase [Alkalihalobacillus pseudalcaliphilus]|uniref:sensor histidine kinase n=1 Tax=Alkalihalobacillus pseudalcaliphilus TaxID=79884 RepID=UPI00064D79A5|nr:HAMP domain-containing sensor histidine kinase [Alkalihalobacillus pseudalcaliphilus]KMK75678.1 histidine kinase [Alkalihalobacillus pseudalcaliphilus]